ncbi:DNA helicase [Variovorax saccharolyticus]|uniref:DNA helicase n=1 Tax=Variovorax saccharolyticus TaxID=3053516 RepID=UPI002578EED9|nr:DNA helicase [Variovorax sp. J31P216]MDM0027924.1 DNA helicase [Variovorax sp. J31P216]
MKISAPIFRLKRKAKLLSREEQIPLHEALNRIASEEGYGEWSLLAAKLSALSPAGKLLSRLQPGDLMLLGARPGQGKTLMSMRLAVEAMKSGNRAVFFTLEYTKKEMADRFRAIGAEYSEFEEMFHFDDCDRISAAYIIATLASAPRGALVIVDYLQLLDQKRENDELAVQIRELKSFARERGLIIVVLSQIDRSYDQAIKPVPDIRDVRLPNPLNLHLFNKACFLNKGRVKFQSTEPGGRGFSGPAAPSPG